MKFYLVAIWYSVVAGYSLHQFKGSAEQDAAVAS